VTLGERLRSILSGLPSEWSLVRLLLTVTEPSKADRAALILGPLAPGRTGSSFRLTVSASGEGGVSPAALERALDRLEREGIDARLSLPGSAAFQLREPLQAAPRRGLAESWDALVAELPADWSDLYLELELTSSADVERAALLLGPVNPLLHEGARPAFRFRAARRYGYGAAPQMARRVLARLDEAGIGGTLRMLRVQSETAPVLTQGPVWRDGGRAV
jgi:hypothetical protein